MIYDGKKITELREAKGWSMTELAKRSQISQPTLWALENQRTDKPKADTMMRIAAALGVPLQSLLSNKKMAGDDAVAAMAAVFPNLKPQHQQALLVAAEALLKQQDK